MAKLTNPIDDVDASRSAIPNASIQEINCQTAGNADTKKIFQNKSKTTVRSSKSPSKSKKSTGRYGSKGRGNTSRLSQKSVETGADANEEQNIGFSASYAHIGVKGNDS